jgi:hypothetical protein
MDDHKLIMISIFFLDFLKHEKNAILFVCWWWLCEEEEKVLQRREKSRKEKRESRGGCLVAAWWLCWLSLADEVVLVWFDG